MNPKIKVVFAMLMLAAIAQAQESTKPAGDAVAGAVQEEPGSDTVTVAPEAVSGGGVIKDGLISLSLKEVELSSVIRIFATLSDANIIIPDLGEASGLVKIDVNLKDVEWKPALQAILDTQGLELYEKIPGSSVYSVRTKAADAPDPMEVKSFKLNYAAVAEVNEMIKDLVPTAGKISVFPARNTIVVQSTAGSLVEIQKMIESVDLPRQQVFIEAKFMELSDSASEKLGIDWQVLGGYGASVGPFGGEYGITKTRISTESGTNNPFFAGAPENSPETYTTANGSKVPFAPLGTMDQVLESKTATALLNVQQFNLALAALKQIGGTKIVSNPKIIVANEEKATIHIGKKKPNVRGTTTGATQNSGTTVTYALDTATPYFEDGIMLEVTPTINTAENITVRIQPTLDRLDAIPFKAPDGTEYYGKSTKTINTLFSLASGQTAAIGGLTQSSDDEVERKVPLLGSIPLIGRLFRYNSKVNDQTETIIFVTVGLANPENINMETGLPEGSSLAMRYDAKFKTDRQIKEEELKILQNHEKERMQKAVKDLQAAEQKRQQSEVKEQPVAVPVEKTQEELKAEYAPLLSPESVAESPTTPEALPEPVEEPESAVEVPETMETLETTEPEQVNEPDNFMKTAAAAFASLPADGSAAVSAEPEAAVVDQDESSAPVVQNGKSPTVIIIEE